MSNAERWPFLDPPNVAVYTLKRILNGENPILVVAHDEEDGGWQFLDGGRISAAEDGAIVSLTSMIKHDPSLAELADLPLGWQAFRAAPGHPWKRVQADP